MAEREIKDKNCELCQLVVGVLKTQEEEGEYMVSGMCSSCQKDVFGTLEEPVDVP